MADMRLVISNPVNLKPKLLHFVVRQVLVFARTMPSNNYSSGLCSRKLVVETAIPQHLLTLHAKQQFSSVDRSGSCRCGNITVDLFEI